MVLSQEWRKDEENKLVKLTMEYSKGAAAGLKRKTMSARAYKAFLRNPQKIAVASGGGNARLKSTEVASGGGNARLKSTEDKSPNAFSRNIGSQTSAEDHNKKCRKFGYINTNSGSNMESSDKDVAVAEAGSQRNTKRPHCSDDCLSADDGVMKKHKKMVNENSEPASVQVGLGGQQLSRDVGSNGACHRPKKFRKDEKVHGDTPCCLSSSNFVEQASVPCERESFDLKDLHDRLQDGLIGLCRALKLSGEMSRTMRSFLDYAVNNLYVERGLQLILHAIQFSICWIAASITKEKVDRKGSLIRAKRLLNYQCTEKQVNLVYTKMLSLKEKYLLARENISDSGREDANIRSMLINKVKILKIDFVEDSASEKHTGEQIFLPEMHVPENEADGSETKNIIKKSQKECHVQILELTQKHQEDIQVIHRTWEKERSKLEDDHKLEVAFIRVMYGRTTAGIGKLALLEKEFADKLKRRELQKKLQLKELESKQLAAFQESGQSVCPSPIEARSCSIRPTGSSGALHLSQSEFDSAEPQLSASKGILELNNDDVSSSHASTGGCETHMKNLASVDSNTKLGTVHIPKSCMAVNELDNQLKSLDDGKTASENGTASVQQNPVAKEASGTVRDEMVENSNCLESGSESVAESNKEDTRRLPEDLAMQSNEPDKVDQEGSKNSSQAFLHSPPTAPSLACESLPNQIQPQNSAELRSLNSPAVENESSSQTEVLTSDLLGNVIAGASQLEIPLADAVTAPTLPVDEHRASENLQPAPDSVNVSCHENHSPVAEQPAEGIDSPRTGESVRREADMHESLNHGNVEERSCFPRNNVAATQKMASAAEMPRDFGGSQFCEPSVATTQGMATAAEMPRDFGGIQFCEPSVATTQGMATAAEMQNRAAPPEGVDGNDPNVAATQEMVTAAELQNQAALQAGVENSNFLLPSDSFSHSLSFQHPSWNSTQPLSVHPLHSELEKSRAEVAYMEMNHKNGISKLKSDCEREMTELYAQIHAKYSAIIQESEAEFRLKRDGLIKNQKKLFMNLTLAEAFRCSLYHGNSSVGHPFPGFPPSFMRQCHQPSSSAPLRGAAGVSAAPSLHTTTPMQTVHLQNASLSARPSLAPNLTSAPRPVSVPFPSPASRPSPHFSRNSGEIRAQAPHLQPFTPSGATLPNTVVSQSRFALIPPVLSPPEPGFRPQQAVMPSSSASVAYLNWRSQQHSGAPATATAALGNVSGLCQASSTNRQVNHQSSRTDNLAADVVCLSDDE